MEPVRLGVVGLGRMGRHHVRCAGAAAGVQLVATCDIDPARAGSAPDGIPFTTDLEDLAGRCDAVVLAVPTDRHGELGTSILRSGAHLLVEKPLAATAADCEKLTDEARRAGRVLAVGHVERMNAAWQQVRPRLRRPRFAEGHRLAAFDPRGTEVDVILDLMIHDLDLVLQAFGQEPSRVEAVGVPVLTDRVDIANARLEFPDGALVGLTASRVSREPVRKLRIFQADAYFSLDLRAGEAEMLSRGGPGPWGVAHETIRAPDGHNPLVRELEAFAAAVRGRASDIPAPAEATRAVRLAERIRDSIEMRRRVWAEADGGGSCGDAPSSS